MPLSGTLTKTQIFDIVTEERNGFIRKKATESVEILLVIIKRSLTSDDALLISGTENFCVRKKRKQNSRNLATTTAMMLRLRKIVIFQCSWGSLWRRFMTTNFNCCEDSQYHVQLRLQNEYQKLVAVIGHLTLLRGLLR